MLLSYLKEDGFRNFIMLEDNNCSFSLLVADKVLVIAYEMGIVEQAMVV